VNQNGNVIISGGIVLLQNAYLLPRKTLASRILVVIAIPHACGGENATKEKIMSKEEPAM
jgi:hypothetical protein